MIKSNLKFQFHRTAINIYIYIYIANNNILKIKEVDKTLNVTPTRRQKKQEVFSEISYIMK